MLGKLAEIPAIALYRQVPLALPECRIGRGRTLPLAAIVRVPETPINEDHFPPGRKHEVRLSRQVLAM
jgi:hypothetical protein